MAALIRLEPRDIPRTWPHIEGWIAAACKRSSGRYLAEDVRRLAVLGEWQLWIAVDEKGVCAVGGSSFVEYPQLKAFRIHFGTGRGRKAWQWVVDEMVAWGKSQGAALSEGDFREGWTRVLRGWRKTHVFVERIN